MIRLIQQVCLLLLYLLLPAFAWSQEVKISEKTEQHAGEKMFVHKVEKGQTLYSIAKAYKTEAGIIEKTNPSVAEGLKTGSLLYIPCTSKKVVSSPGMYTVQPGDGLFAISRKNGVSPEQLRAWNPGIDSLIKPGKQLVLFPQEKKPETKLPTPAPQVLTPANDGFLHVACLLPFYLEKNAFDEPAATDVERSERVEKPAEISGKSYKALEFYTGLRYALDSLERRGLKIMLHTLDCPQDSESVEQVLQSPELGTCSLVLGPFHPAFNNPVAAYCKRNNKWYFSLFSQQTKLLLNNDHACKLSASASTQARSLSSVIRKHFSGNKIIIIHNNLKKEKILVDTFRAQFVKSGKDSATSFVFKGSGAEGLKKKLDAQKANVLLVCSNDQAFVTDFFNKIKTLGEDYKLVVFGLESWQDYDNIEYETLEKFSVHLPLARYCDYHAAGMSTLLSAFREIYHTDPGEYSLMAIDMALGLFPLFAGGQFPDEATLTQLRYRGYCTGFGFEKTSPESGYENIFSRVVYYSNYEMNAYEDN